MSTPIDIGPNAGPPNLPTFAVRLRRSRGVITQAYQTHRDEVPFPDVERDVPGDKVLRYFANKFVLDAWIRGDSEHAAILEARKRWGVDVPRGSSRRMFERFSKLNPDSGEQYGYFACVPGLQTDSEDGSQSRAKLERLFATHPAIGKALKEFVQNRTLNGSAPRATVTPGSVVDAFWFLCKQAQPPIGDAWPFTGKPHNVYELVRRWYEVEKARKPVKTATNELGDDMGKAVERDIRGIGAQPLMATSLLAYQRVEMDEWKSDVATMLRFRGMRSYQELKVSRLWALAPVETRCNLVLASGLAYGDRYTAADINRVFMRAVMPPKQWSVPGFDSSELRYAAGACYPAELPEFRGNTWMEFALDGDAIHRSPAEQILLETVFGGTFAKEGVAPTERCHVEGYFGTLTKFAEWFASATGNRPDSPARRDPEDAARLYRVDAIFLEWVLDLHARNHNVTPQARHDGLSPIGMAEELLAEGRVYCRPFDVFRNNLYRLLPYSTCNITSQRAQNGAGRLGVNFGGAFYSSKELNDDSQLRGAADMGAIIYVEEDARFGTVVPNAFKMKRFKVVVQGRWAHKPHSLKYRTLTVAYGKTKRKEAKAEMPQLGPAVMQALANHAARDSSVANVVGEAATVFEDRHSLGLVPTVSMTHDEALRLIDEAMRLEGSAPVPEAPQPPTPETDRATPEAQRPEPGRSIYGSEVHDDDD